MTSFGLTQLTSSGMVDGFEAPLPSSLLLARASFFAALPGSDCASLTSEDTLKRRASEPLRWNLTLRRDFDMIGVCGIGGGEEGEGKKKGKKKGEKKKKEKERLKNQDGVKERNLEDRRSEVEVGVKS